MECPLLSQFDSPMILTGSGAQVGEASNDRTGWTVGAGVEWMFAPGWSVFGEYNYMDFGTPNVTFIAPPGLSSLGEHVNVSQTAQTVLFGVNYKFNFGSPVFGRY